MNTRNLNTYTRNQHNFYESRTGHSNNSRNMFDDFETGPRTQQQQRVQNIEQRHFSRERDYGPEVERVPSRFHQPQNIPNREAPFPHYDCNPHNPGYFPEQYNPSPGRETDIRERYNNSQEFPQRRLHSRSPARDLGRMSPGGVPMRGMQRELPADGNNDGSTWRSMVSRPEKRVCNGERDLRPKRKKDLTLPPRGQPGGLDDPNRRSLCGSRTKWYLRYLQAGFPPDEAIRMTREPIQPAANFKLNQIAGLDRDRASLEDSSSEPVWDEANPEPAWDGPNPEEQVNEDAHLFASRADERDKEFPGGCDDTHRQSPSASRQQLFPRKWDMNLPPRGQPGGLDDPNRKSLCGSRVKWYMRYLAAGFPPDEAIRMAKEPTQPAANFKLNQTPDLERDRTFWDPEPSRNDPNPEETNWDVPSSEQPANEDMPFTSRAGEDDSGWDFREGFSREKSLSCDAERGRSSQYGDDPEQLTNEDTRPFTSRGDEREANPVKVFLIPLGYPELGLNHEEKLDLEEAITIEVASSRLRDPLRFNSIAFRKGYLEVECFNKHAADWLMRTGSQLASYGGPKVEAKFHLKEEIHLEEEKKCSIRLYLKHSADKSNQHIKRLLNAQNPHDVSSWSLVSRKNQKNGLSVTFEIDEKCAHEIAANGHILHYRMGKVQVNGIKRFFKMQKKLQKKLLNNPQNNPQNKDPVERREML